MKLLLAFLFEFSNSSYYFTQNIFASEYIFFVYKKADLLTVTTCIHLKSGQEFKENKDNLFGEKVYQELSVSVVLNDDSIREKSLKMGQLLSSNMGNPLMVFLGVTLLKDECSKLFLRGRVLCTKYNEMIINLCME